MVLLFIFRKEEKVYKMQSLIQYVIVGCLTPALSCDSGKEMMDSRDVLETDHGHTIHHSKLEDR